MTTGLTSVTGEKGKRVWGDEFLTRRTRNEARKIKTNFNVDVLKSQPLMVLELEGVKWEAIIEKNRNHGARLSLLRPCFDKKRTFNHAL
jgi:hypothetical protein